MSVVELEKQLRAKAKLWEASSVPSLHTEKLLREAATCIGTLNRKLRNEREAGALLAQEGVELRRELQKYRRVPSSAERGTDLPEAK